MGFSCGDGGMEGSSIGFGEVWGAAIGMQGPAVGMEGPRTQLWEWRDEEPIYRVGRGMGRSQRDGDTQELAVGLERCREQIRRDARTSCRDGGMGTSYGAGGMQGPAVELEVCKDQLWGQRDAEPVMGLEGHQCLP